MIFRILAKNFANITKAAFYLSRQTFCQKKFLEKNISTLADFWGKNLRISAAKSLEEIPEGTTFAKKGNSNHFLTLGEKVSKFSPKVPSSAVKTAFNVSGWWNPGKKMFLEVQNSPIFSDFQTNFSDCKRWVSSRMSIYAFRLPKRRFWKGLLFGIWASQSRTSGHKSCGLFFEKNRQGCRKQIPCFKMILLEKNTFRNFHSSLSLLLDYQQKLFSDVWQKIWRPGCRNCPLRFQKYLREKKLSHEK